MAPPDADTREQLIDQAVAFLGDQAPDRVADVRERVGAVLGSASEDELAELLRRAATTGQAWGYHAPVELARQVNHVMASIVFAPGSTIENQDVLEVARSRSVTFVPNHLSFSDANLFECLLHQQGHDDIAQRLLVLAGPKVYSDFYRRFSSLCFGTVKTPQSQSRATGEAVMPRRQVAELARQTIDAVRERRAQGDHLLFFVEGTRSRDARLQRTLAAASRYLDDADTLIVPVGIAGSDRLVPIGEERAHASKVTARLGSPVAAGELVERCGGKRRLVMDVVGLLIAAQLPTEYRGDYADERGGVDDARAVALQLVAKP